MDSMRKIFTGLDFGGRRIKNVKIDGQPYIINFDFTENNQDTPVPEEIVKDLVYIFENNPSTPIFIKYNNDVVNGCLVMNDSSTIGINIYDTIPQTLGNIVLANFLIKSIDINKSDYSWLSFEEVKPIQCFTINITADSNLIDNHFEALSDFIGIIGICIDSVQIYPAKVIKTDTIITVIADVVDIVNNRIEQHILTYTASSAKYETQYVDLGLSTESIESFYVVDLNNYTVDIFNELSQMTLGTIIKVITTDNRPVLCQLMDLEPDYIVINSYMQYDDYDENPHIVAYTLNADGTLLNPIERIKLETTGGGDRFLSDLGWYKEIKIPELLNAKVTQAEYDVMESEGTLDNNTIYYIIG